MPNPSPAHAEQLARSQFTDQVLGALVDVDGGAEEARAISELVPDGIPQLWHGYEQRTSEVLRGVMRRGTTYASGSKTCLRSRTVASPRTTPSSSPRPWS